VPTYGRLRYRDVYPGIDLVYYGTQRQLEYDFIISPGAGPKDIVLQMAGMTHIGIDKTGAGVNP
jgi:hypothetical protein